jgi:hypothetical protein
MGPIRQFLTMAKPWQRVVVGVVLAAVGGLLGSYVISAIGVVLVGLVVIASFRRWRGHGAPSLEGAAATEMSGMPEDVIKD